MNLTFPKQVNLYMVDRANLKNSNTRFTSEKAMLRYQEQRKAERQRWADDFVRKVLDGA